MQQYLLWPSTPPPPPLSLAEEDKKNKEPPPQQLLSASLPPCSLPLFLRLSDYFSLIFLSFCLSRHHRSIAASTKKSCNNVHWLHLLPQEKDPINMHNHAHSLWYGHALHGLLFIPALSCYPSCTGAHGIQWWGHYKRLGTKLLSLSFPLSLAVKPQMLVPTPAFLSACPSPRPSFPVLIPFLASQCIMGATS